jgi:hypothetical protein
MALAKSAESAIFLIPSKESDGVWRSARISSESPATRRRRVMRLAVRSVRGNEIPWRKAWIGSMRFLSG